MKLDKNIPVRVELTPISKCVKMYLKGLLCFYYFEKIN